MKLNGDSLLTNKIPDEFEQGDIPDIWISTKVPGYSWCARIGKAGSGYFYGGSSNNGYVFFEPVELLKWIIENDPVKIQFTCSKDQWSYVNEVYLFLGHFNHFRNKMTVKLCGGNLQLFN